MCLLPMFECPVILSRRHVRVFVRVSTGFLSSLLSSGSLSSRNVGSVCAHVGLGDGRPSPPPIARLPLHRASRLRETRSLPTGLTPAAPFPPKDRAAETVQTMPPNGLVLFRFFSPDDRASEIVHPRRRQATEMMDAMDSCALSHCAMRRSEGDAEVRGLAKGTLIKMLDAHASAVAAGVKARSLPWHRHNTLGAVLCKRCSALQAPWPAACPRFTSASSECIAYYPPVLRTCPHPDLLMRLLGSLPRIFPCLGPSIEVAQSTLNRPPSPQFPTSGFSDAPASRSLRARCRPQGSCSSSIREQPLPVPSLQCYAWQEAGDTRPFSATRSCCDGPGQFSSVVERFEHGCSSLFAVCRRRIISVHTLAARRSTKTRVGSSTASCCREGVCGGSRRMRAICGISTRSCPPLRIWSTEKGAKHDPKARILHKFLPLAELS